MDDVKQQRWRVTTVILTERIVEYIGTRDQIIAGCVPETKLVIERQYDPEIILIQEAPDVDQA